MQEERKNRILANWLMIGVGMLIIQVLLGGVTRLTGSGLSITEWQPIMGALPPMNATEWQEAFDKYQQIAQYKYINNHFTLDDFKFIFFWEWFHRQWARFMGLVFLVPFIFFLVKGYFKKWMILPLIMLFVLGGMQGLIGWIMVSTGIDTEHVYVTHFSLAAHFIAAMVLISYTLVFALSIKLQPKDRVYHPGLSRFAYVITTLLAVQLVYGAFMAGMKAATAAPTWPDINGDLVPAGLFIEGLLEKALHNPITIHFIHRTLAYLILVLVIAWWWKARRLRSSAVFNKAARWPLLFVLMQVILGIFTVLTSNHIVAGQFGLFESLAEMHQLIGMLLLLSLVTVIYLLRPAVRI